MTTLTTLATALGWALVGVLSALWGVVKIPWWLLRLVALTLVGRASMKRSRTPYGTTLYAWTVDR